MKTKGKRPGNAWMKKARRKKVEVWLEPEEFTAFKELCKSQRRPMAKMARILFRYVSKGGVTAIEILRGVATDRAAG